MIRILYFCLIEHGVVRTLGRCGIFFGVKRIDFAIFDAGQAMDGLGEVVPRADALVAEMIDTGHYPLTDGRKNGTGQVAGVGRSTYLVEDDTERIAFLAEANHGLHEIVTESGI